MFTGDRSKLFQAVIPAIWEAEIRTIVVQVYPEQKINKTPSQQISLAQWDMPVTLDMWKRKAGESWSGSPRQSCETLCEKITK
jgi:hypothetical protein